MCRDQYSTGCEQNSYTHVGVHLLKADFPTAGASVQTGTAAHWWEVQISRPLTPMYGQLDFSSPVGQPRFPPGSPGSEPAQVGASPPLQIDADAVRSELAALELDVEAALTTPGLAAQHVLMLLRSTRSRLGALGLGDDDGASSSSSSSSRGVLPAGCAEAGAGGAGGTPVTQPRRRNRGGRRGSRRRRDRHEPAAFAGLDAQQRSSKVMTLVCVCDRELKVRDLAAETGRKDVIKMQIQLEIRMQIHSARFRARPGHL